MIGLKNNPEIIENVIDERVDTEFVADYFTCEDKDCPRYRDQDHTHLLHVDPNRSNIAIEPQDFRLLEPCGNVTCPYEDWSHVHLPKKWPSKNY